MLQRLIRLTDELEEKLNYYKANVDTIPLEEGVALFTEMMDLTMKINLAFDLSWTDDYEVLMRIVNIILDAEKFMMSKEFCDSLNIDHQGLLKLSELTTAPDPSGNSGVILPHVEEPEVEEETSDVIRVDFRNKKRL